MICFLVFIEIEKQLAEKWQKTTKQNYQVRTRLKDILDFAESQENATYGSRFILTPKTH